MRLLKNWLPVILWAAIILSAANDQFSDEETAGWLERLFGMSMPVAAANVLMRKSGHLLAYAAGALLAWRAHRTYFVAMLVPLAVSIADETLQAMTLTREGSPFDVLLDGCGAALALLVMAWLRERSSASGVS
jgi:VanZ family protein